MNNLKKISLSLATLLVSVVGFAQSPVHFGPKLGVNYSKIRFSEGAKVPDSQFYRGFHLGFFGRLDLVRVYLQPELVYNEKGSKVIATEASPSGSTATTDYVSLKTLDIPVMLGYKVIDAKIINVRMMGGPVFSYTLKDRAEAIERITNGCFNFNKQNLGYQLGVGIDVASLTLDMRYEGSLKKISTQFNSRPSIFLISLGFKII